MCGKYKVQDGLCLVAMEITKRNATYGSCYFLLFLSGKGEGLFQPFLLRRACEKVLYFRGGRSM